MFITWVLFLRERPVLDITVAPGILAVISETHQEIKLKSGLNEQPWIGVESSLSHSARCKVYISNGFLFFWAVSKRSTLFRIDLFKILDMWVDPAAETWRASEELYFTVQFEWARETYYLPSSTYTEHTDAHDWLIDAAEINRSSVLISVLIHTRGQKHVFLSTFFHLCIKSPCAAVCDSHYVLTTPVFGLNHRLDDLTNILLSDFH